MNFALVRRKIGPEEPIFITAEIGINHNGNLELAKKLIDAAAKAGCDAVKFQKRTVSVVYSAEELAKPREVPVEIISNAIKRQVLPQENIDRLVASNFQETTNGDLKWALEFTRNEYSEIDSYCRQKGILWSASCWDEQSVDFIDEFNPRFYKIASASLTDNDLLRHIKSKGKPIMLSTGMSTLEEIDQAVKILGKDKLIILHCNSTYPSKNEELNLLVIKTLAKRYYPALIGYSGHEIGLASSVMAAVLDAYVIERHITLDRAMWGSDHAASIEPQGLQRLVRDIRVWEKARGDGKKKVYESELAIREKLRRK